MPKSIVRLKSWTGFCKKCGMPIGRKAMRGTKMCITCFNKNRMMKTLKCVTCKSFFKSPYGDTKYCKKCSTIRYKKNKCVSCGKSVNPYSKYCKPCFADKLRENPKCGKDNPNYRHGEAINLSGYHKWKKKNDIKYSIRCRAADILRKKLKRRMLGKNYIPAFSVLPYTVDELKEHIESLFSAGMTWEKFCQGEIHIDHVIPDIYFNYESINDVGFKRSFALDNLQPLWARDNINKSDRLFVDGILSDKRARHK